MSGFNEESYLNKSVISQLQVSSQMNISQQLS